MKSLYYFTSKTIVKLLGVALGVGTVIWIEYTVLLSMRYSFHSFILLPLISSLLLGYMLLYYVKNIQNNREVNL